MATHAQDILIVGGGITGVALAYGLAGSGRRITVLDHQTPTNRASRTNCGLIWVQSKFLHLPDYARWGFLSSRAYPELVSELEALTGLRIPVQFRGGLIPVLSEAEYQQRGDYIAKLRETLGEYRGGMIDRRELDALLPGIRFGKEVTGAAWCEEDGVIEPLALLRAFRAALPRKGVELLDRGVLDVQPQDGGYRVTTDNGIYEGGTLILAAGLANRRFARFALPSLPVYPDMGQILLVERMPYVMPIPVLGATQSFGGTVILGFRHENAGHRMTIEQKGVSGEGQWAMRVWPELAGKRVIRAWTGLRVMPNDSMAIYSRLPGHANAYLINTHSAVTMAAAHARLLPPFLLGGDLPETARGMTLQRFGFTC